MVVVLMLISLTGLAVALILPGWSDLLLLAGPCLVASLWLFLRGWQSRARSRDAIKGMDRVNPFQRAAAGQGKTRPYVILDGSNVMHWQGNLPSLDPVLSAVRQMAAKGFTVGVIFDANAGYKLQGRYQDDSHLARRLGLPEDRVLVVPKGVPADEYILKAARKLGARVVTNDRFRDWLDGFPEAAQPGFLIRGTASDKGEVLLNARDLASGAAMPASP